MTPPRSALHALLLLACVAACDLGVYEDPADGGPNSPDAPPGQVDAPPGTPDAAPGTPDAPVGPTADANTQDCDEPVSSVGDGYHKRGQPCLPCHDVAIGATPAFTLSGTLYTDAAGTNTISGATIHALDDDGRDITMVTTDNGNFWSSDAVTFPASIRVSMCPDTVSMPATISSSGADCNVGGCHGSGARVHLP